MCAAKAAKTAVFFIAALVVAAGACKADGATFPWRQFERSKAVYLVSNENPTDLEAYRVKCPVRRVEIVPLSLISLRIREIGKEPVIFLINRSKRVRCNEEEEKLLPYASDAIKPDELITFMSRNNKRDLRREGSWDVLISAPSQKWLFQAMDDFLSTSSIPNPPVIKRIKNLAVVGTDGKETAEKWVGPVERSTDWEFHDAARLDAAASFDGFDELYLISRDSLPQIPVHLMARLPGGVKETLSNGDLVTDMLVEKQRKTDGDGSGWRAAIVAPNREFLGRLMSRYRKMEDIPDSLERKTLHDLTAFKSAAVVARSADRNRTDLIPYLDEMASRITTALSSSTKLRCANRQDMKEAIYEALQTGQRIELEPSKAEDLGSAVDSHTLVVIDLLDISTISTFRANDPIRVSAHYEGFTQPAPAKPRQPDLDDRRYGVFGPKKYRGYDDPKYRDDMREYREELDRWERAYRDWQYKRYQHEQAAMNRDVEWKVSCDVTESAAINANVRIYSLEQAPGYAPGVVIYSCAINGKCEKTRLHKEDRVVVRGEGKRPGSIRVPPSDHYISDTSIVAEAINRAAGEFLSSLHTNALLPGDLLNLKTNVVKVKDTNPDEGHSVVSASPVIDERIYEQTGVFPCLQAPKAGEETENLKKHAVEAACSKILTVILMEYPDAGFELSDVMNEAEVESHGWNPGSKEYRAKVKFIKKT